MSYAPSSPVTGLAQTGLTSPTYTLTTDVAPTNSGKQHAVTALGGTQTGVTSHSVSDPFTLTFIRPAVLKVQPTANPVTGLVTKSVGRNKYELLTRKGVLPLADQARAVMFIRTTIEVPAGADSADPANVRAALSAHFGVLSQVSAGIGDTAITSII